MKIYQKIFWVIGLVALAALSLGGFLVNIGLISRFVIIGTLTTLEQDITIGLATLVIFGFLFVLSIYLPIVTWVRKGEGGPAIPLKNPLGEVEISQKAICEFIQRVGKEVQGVEDVKAKLKSTEEGVDVSLTLSAQAQGEIPRLIDELQTVVKNYLNNTVGIESVREIKVKVAKIL